MVQILKKQAEDVLREPGFSLPQAITNLYQERARRPGLPAAIRLRRRANADEHSSD